MVLELSLHTLVQRKEAEGVFDIKDDQQSAQSISTARLLDFKT